MQNKCMRHVYNAYMTVQSTNPYVFCALVK
jgi:hypothetical protein